MAELILTEKEKADHSYLDWDNAALGKLVKAMAVKASDEYGADTGMAVTGGLLLASMARDVNSEYTTFALEGTTDKGDLTGGYRITIERIDEDEGES